MNTVNYISREYVPRVDLETLGNSYNTLEEGHQAAVKAASDLKTTVANMAMNESEDGFKEQLIGEIQQTIDNNTLYGNSYGSLDNLVKQVGDINSDGRIIGRLRSQKAKKEYDAKVDAMSIPDGMKQMYKDENPYYYEDGDIDPNTGRVQAGELWKPTTNPVTTIPDSEIQKYALQIAAEESGGGDQISFLDANGRETYDPAQSVDGLFYRKIGTTYHRLPKDKIARAYQVALDAIPGARDSLHQDYKYLAYQYDKNIEKMRSNGSNNIVPYVPGYTDSNGNIYTETQWLNNKINNFANVAAYNRVTTNVDFGTALQNRRAHGTSYGSGSGSVGYDNYAYNERLGQITAGTEEVETNTFANVQNAKAAASKTVSNLIAKYFPDGFEINGKTYTGNNSMDELITALSSGDSGATGPNSVAARLISMIPNINTGEKSKIVNAISGYYQANTQYNNMLNAAGNERDRDSLLFSANVFNREFTNDNKYGRSIIKLLNDFYKYNKEATFEVGKELLPALYAQYNISGLNELKNLGLNIKNLNNKIYTISVDAEHRNLLPELLYNVDHADNSTSGDLGGWFSKTYRGRAGSRNYVVYGDLENDGFLERTGHNQFFRDLRHVYTGGINNSAVVEENIGVGKGIRSFTTGSYASFGSAHAAMYPESIDTGETLHQFQTRQDEQVDRDFASGAFNAGQIQYLDDSEHAYIDIAKNQDAKNLIQQMYADDTQRKKVQRTIKIPTGTEAGGTQGYKLVFTVPKGLGNDSFKEGDRVSLIVSGVSAEESAFNPASNPDVLAENAVIAARATGGQVIVDGYTDSFGYTDLSLNQDSTYSTAFMGVNKNMTESEAVDYASAMFALQQLKMQYISGIYNINDPYSNSLLVDKVNKLANVISVTTGKDVSQVGYGILDYLKEVDE